MTNSTTETSEKMMARHTDRNRFKMKESLKGWFDAFIDRKNKKYFTRDSPFALERRAQLEGEFMEVNGVKFNSMKWEHRSTMDYALTVYKIKAVTYAFAPLHKQDGRGAGNATPPALATTPKES